MMNKIEKILTKESNRQTETIPLCAAENIVSERIMKILSHPIMNKTAEGYPGKRYHGGTEYLDEIELYAQETVNKLFDAKYSNVQPHCAANANYAVLFSILKKGDTILSMKLDHGGHITHGAKISITGEVFNTINYNVKQDSFLIDYDQVRELAIKHKPRLIIAGSSAYPRVIDFKIFRTIADEVGAYFLADVSHFAGLIAGGVYPNPVNIADFTTFSTYKSFRGPRGGVVLMGCRYDEKSYKYSKLNLSQAIDFSVFPGVQSALLPEHIAAKAASFEEASEPEYKVYAKNIVENAKSLAKGLSQKNIFVLTGGTDSHQVIIDAGKLGLTGFTAQKVLESLGIIQNRNLLPYDLKSPFITSGIRFGTSATTTLGYGKEVHLQLGYIISDILLNTINLTDSTYELRSNFQTLKKIIADIVKSNLR